MSEEKGWQFADDKAKDKTKGKQDYYKSKSEFNRPNFQHNRAGAMRSKLPMIALGLGGVALILYLSPRFFVQKHKRENRNLAESPDPLPRQAQMRGPYVNSGSKDVGPYNPEWKTAEEKKQKK